jgi:hypothetical protein
MAAPAIAEDRLGLGGEMRVRGWSKDDGTNTASYMDQRLRIGGKISVAEGVSVTFRTDITEHTWGNGGNEFGSGRIGIQQWDRAHLDITKGNVHLRAGTQYAGFGLLGGTVNSQDSGLRVDIKGPVAISAFWLLDDQNGGTSTADSYLTAANVAHKTDAYAANVFIANQTKALNDRESVFLVGVNLTMDVSAVKLQGELDFFTGDAAENVDAMGTQLFVDASMAASDAATVGAQLYYAIAPDAGEVQYQNLGNDFNGYDPIFDLGTNLSNEQMSAGRPFSIDGAGVMGVRLYGNFKASDAVNLGASFAYLTPEDDALTTVDSVIAYAASATYQVMANTSLQAQIQFVNIDEPNTDDEMAAGLGLFVNF